MNDVGCSPHVEGDVKADRGSSAVDVHLGFREDKLLGRKVKIAIAVGVAGRFGSIPAVVRVHEPSDCDRRDGIALLCVRAW